VDTKAVRLNLKNSVTGVVFCFEALDLGRC